MNTLNTRKIICVLIAFVLVLGMQGIADALTFQTRTSGDLVTVSRNQEFTITFYPQPKSPVAQFSGTTRGSRTAFEKADATASATVSGFVNNKSVSGLTAENANTYYYYDRVTTQATSTERATTTRTWLSESDAYDYNDEAVTINSNGIILTRSGNTLSSTDGSADVLVDRSEDSHLRLGSSITLKGSHGTPGAFDIVITDNSPAADFPDGTAPDPRASITFTIFVVLDRAGTPAIPTLEVDTDTNYKTDGNDFSDQTVDTAEASAGTNFRIEYKIIQGPGRLYVERGTAPDVRKSSAVPTLSTSNAALVKLDANGGTTKVQATAAGAAPTTGIFIFGYPNVVITGGNGQEGVFGGRLEDPLVVKVTDGKNRPISGLAVTFGKASSPATGASAKFIPVSGTSVYIDTAGDLVATFATATGGTQTVTPMNSPDPADTILVQTDSRGEAKTYFQLSSTTTETSQGVTVSAGGVNPIAPQQFRFTAGTGTRRPILSIDSGDNQRTDDQGDIEDPLIIVVRRDGNLKPNEKVTFRTIKGTLVGGYTKTTFDAFTGDRSGLVDSTTGSKRAYGITDGSGRAQITYFQDPGEGSDTVTATISGDDYEKTVTFNVNGRAAPTRDDPVDDDDDDAPTVTVRVPSSVDGTAGSTTTLRVTAATNAAVSAFALGNTFPRENVGSFTRSGTIHSSILTLPDQVANYSLTVFVDGASYPVTVRVSQPTRQAQGRLDIQTDVSGGPGEPKPVRITAIDADGTGAADVTVRLRITAGGGSFSPASVTTGDDGTATSTFTRGSTAGSNYFITATTTPTGYDTPDSRGVRITITAGTATQPPGDTSVPTAGEAAAIDVYDGDGQRGIPNARLSELLVVEVTDANGNPVSGERVTFRTTIGSGRFSPSRPRTNGGGRAQTWFTPTSSGTLRIAASVEGVSARAVFRVTTGAPPASLTKVSGDSQSGTPGDALANPFVVEVKDADGETIEGVPVAFSVAAGGGSLSETSATTDRNGRAETTLTLGSRVGINSVEASVSGVDPVTFNTSIEPEILVAAANRPVMYWIDGGALYRLAGAKATQIAASANGIAVGGGKVYWTTTTGASAGTINSANLDGSGAKVLTRIMAVPMGIAVDTADSKLYWTNARGRIQSANLDGSGIRNVQQNLSNPTDLVVANGFIYWTENDTAIRRVNLKGQKQVQDVATNLDTVGGLAVGGGKVYWTEQTGASAGTVNGANLNGTQFETLATLLSAPMGIAVDTAGSKLYWTNARGRIQSANLDGSGIRNVVKGLIAPSQLLTAGANTDEPVAKQPTKKDTSAYDVNNDGKVDNVDASLVASGLDTGNAKYDVNKDGTVNFLDLLLIFDNRDADAAGAPTVVGMQLTTVQRDRIEAQIDLLIATGDRSAAAMRTLVYLQQLLVTARPEKTQLLANYPNPFNPETWIPYELATDTDVRITIYNAQGIVIRVLHLGQQSAGYYTDRERAAYWDGRNALGEQVASGIYFYQLETDDMSSLRKMVILK